MQRAATALAGISVDLLRHRRGAVRGGRVVALVGSGNNGGDALWAMRALALRGVAGSAIGDTSRMHPEGSAAARAAGVRLLDWTAPEAARAVADADLALDGIVGIGGAGALREPAAGVVRALATAGVPIVAIDVPSGVDADTGEVAGAAVQAAVTVCFGVLKPGLLVGPGRDHAGSVTVVDIGLEPDDLEPTAWVPGLADLGVPGPDSQAHKYRRGVVGITAGSTAYPGAALLAVGGARRSGAGMVAFTSGTGLAGGVDPIGSLVIGRYPDVVLSADRPVDARCVGCGLGRGPATEELVRSALADPAPLVVDASGLAVLATRAGADALAARADRGWITVLTPHTGEFTRLGMDGAGGRLLATRRAAAATGAVVVLKGPGTVVAAPDGTTAIDTFGSPALATAGSGDVLAGLLGGMLAMAARSGPMTPAQAALVAARAVGLHGLAGRLAAASGGPVTALDVLEQLPAAHATARAAD
jgi:hydroxyethylthiazole kinase-like uncharacterized protein yjeF